MFTCLIAYFPTHIPTYLLTDYVLTYLLTFLLFYLITYSSTHLITHFPTYLDGIVLAYGATESKQLGLTFENETKGVLPAKTFVVGNHP